MTDGIVDETRDSVILRLECAGNAYAVTIRGASPQVAARTFLVTEKGEASASLRTHEYHVASGSQSSYLDVFEALAGDIGSRLPSSRRNGFASGEPVPLRPLLTENVSPDIVYGYGDPCALRVPPASARDDASYYVVVTSNDAPESFPILRSHDLRTWELAAFVFPHDRKPQWAAALDAGGEYWAPELHFVRGRYVLCFAARERSGSLAIGLAFSASPSGPFVPAEQPLIGGGVIDPHVFVDDDGSTTLYWKVDNNDVWPSLLSHLLHDRPELIVALFASAEDRRTACLSALLWPWVGTLGPMERFFAQHVLIEAVVADFSGFGAILKRFLKETREPLLRARVSDILHAMRTVIYGQSIDSDNWTLQGKRTVVLENDLPWEGHLVEGVWVTKQLGKYFMFYSGNDFTTEQYGIGCAVGSSPCGPFTKMQQPFIRSTSEWWGPGHASVAQGPDKQPCLFLHAYRPGRVGYKQFRALLALPVTFGEGTVKWSDR